MKSVLLGSTVEDVGLGENRRLNVLAYPLIWQIPDLGDPGKYEGSDSVDFFDLRFQRETR